MNDKKIDNKRKVLSWIPLFGMFYEVYNVVISGEENYLSNPNNPVLFFLSSIYHHSVIMVPLVILLQIN